MTRKLFVAASRPLMASLEEQSEALGGFTPCPLEAAADLELPPNERCSAAVLLDADFCDAPALARRLRAQGFAGAIIVIGAACENADAALARPFRLADLAARLAAGPRIANPEADLRVRLTEKEAAILARLEQARGAAISKEILLADVWGYGPNVTTRTLETHIHRLRRKIEADPARPQKLLTEAGGYRLARGAG